MSSTGGRHLALMILGILLFASVVSALILRRELSETRHELNTLKLSLKAATDQRSIEHSGAAVLNLTSGRSDRSGALREGGAAAGDVPVPAARTAAVTAPDESIYDQASDAIVYTSGARVQVSDDITIASTTGQLVSNRQQTVFAGDPILTHKGSAIAIQGSIIRIIKNPPPKPFALRSAESVAPSPTQ